jgi:predicted PurR-regulated permease PerM
MWVARCVVFTSEFEIAGSPSFICHVKLNSEILCRSYTLYCICVGGQIIMGTVVLSVIGNSVVSWAEDYLPGRRRLLVATMYVVILAALIGVGVMYIPRLTQEGAKLIARIQTEDPYTLVSDKLRSALGENVTDQLERFLLVMTKPDTVVMESVAGSRTQRLRALQQMIKEYAGAMVVWLATLISATSRFALQVH